MRCHFTQQNGHSKKNITSAGKDVEKVEISYIAGGNVKGYNCSEKVWQFLQKVKHESYYYMTQKFHF